MSEVIEWLISMIVITALLFSGAYWVKSSQCLARWDDSTYTFWTKCMVNQDGVYVPEDRIWFDR